MPFAWRDEFLSHAASQQAKRILCDYGAQDKPGFDAQPRVWEKERITSVVATGFLYCGYTLEILAQHYPSPFEVISRRSFLNMLCLSSVCSGNDRVRVNRNIGLRMSKARSTDAE